MYDFLDGGAAERAARAMKRLENFTFSGVASQNDMGGGGPFPRYTIEFTVRGPGFEGTLIFNEHREDLLKAAGIEGRRICVAGLAENVETRKSHVGVWVVASYWRGRADQPQIDPGRTVRFQIPIEKPRARFDYIGKSLLDDSRSVGGWGEFDVTNWQPWPRP